jgi:hypothetical protein
MFEVGDYILLKKNTLSRNKHTDIILAKRKEDKYAAKLVLKQLGE